MRLVTAIIILVLLTLLAITFGYILYQVYTENYTTFKIVITSICILALLLVLGLIVLGSFFLNIRIVEPSGFGGGGGPAGRIRLSTSSSESFEGLEDLAAPAGPSMKEILINDIKLIKFPEFVGDAPYPGIEIKNLFRKYNTVPTRPAIGNISMDFLLSSIHKDMVNDFLFEGKLSRYTIEELDSLPWISKLTPIDPSIPPKYVGRTLTYKSELSFDHTHVEEVVNEYFKIFPYGNAFDLLIPLARGKTTPFSSVCGHFNSIIIQKRGYEFTINTFDPRRDLKDIQILVNEIRNFIIGANDMSKTISLKVKQYGCALQASNDFINCGFYTFDILMNYLKIGQYVRDVDLKYICPGEAIGKRGLFTMGLGYAKAAITDRRVEDRNPFKTYDIGNGKYIYIIHTTPERKRIISFLANPKS